MNKSRFGLNGFRRGLVSKCRNCTLWYLRRCSRLFFAGGNQEDGCETNGVRGRRKSLQMELSDIVERHFGVAYQEYFVRVAIEFSSGFLDYLGLIVLLVNLLVYEMGIIKGRSQRWEINR